MRRHSWLIAALLLTPALVACLRGEIVINGNTGGGGGGTVSSGGVIAVGTVSRFGSIFVNGVEYGSSGASISIDGTSNSAETALQLGMVVTVQGTMNSGSTTNGTAANITYRPELRGAADGAPSIAGDSATFSIFGLIVQTNADTVFDNPQGLSSIAAGTVVEVSGFRDSNGQVHATRVAQTVTGNGVALKGSISAVTGTTFAIGSLTVNYAGAALTNIPAGGLINGLVVQVTSAASPQNGVLVASAVSVQASSLNASDGAQAQLEGLVTGFSGSGFSLNGQSVTVSSATTYTNGTSSDLSEGSLVQVIGTMGGGVVAASSVRFVPTGATLLTANVTAVDINNNTVTVFGIPGIVANVDKYTTIGDTSSTGTRPFGLNNFIVGNTVMIRGVQTGTNTIAATGLLRTDANSQVSLKGAVATAVIPTLTIVGINASTNVDTLFLDSNGNSLTQLQFFNQALPGTTVSVQGTFTGTAIATTRAQLGS